MYCDSSTFTRICILTLVALLPGCSSTEAVPTPPEATAEIVDFSGYWEKNYQASDDINTEFNLFLYDIQRRLNPTQDSNSRNSVFDTGAAGVTMEAVVGLARFTEEITRMPMLRIEQDRSRVRIDREDDYDLLCEFYTEQFVRSETAFGSEICGWNGSQLVFQTNLPDGLSIFHRVTLSPRGQELNITTTVTSARVASPLTISNYYRRYQPPETDIDCVLTITRNNVCRRTGN